MPLSLSPAKRLWQEGGLRFRTGASSAARMRPKESRAHPCAKIAQRNCSASRPRRSRGALRSPRTSCTRRIARRSFTVFPSLDGGFRPADHRKLLAWTARWCAAIEGASDGENSRAEGGCVTTDVQSAQHLRSDAIRHPAGKSGEMNRVGMLSRARLMSAPGADMVRLLAGIFLPRPGGIDDLSRRLPAPANRP